MHFYITSLKYVFSHKGICKIHEKQKRRAVEIASSLCDVVDGSGTDKIQFLIKELIDKIVVDDENIHIYWKFV